MTQLSLVRGLSSGIMLCLDSILDTRHGTIKKSYPETFDRFRNSAKYYLRKTDNWQKVDPSLDNSLLTLRYAGRDLETIKNSQLTMITRAVMELVTEILSKIKGCDPETAAFFFVINFYPYRLDEDLISAIALKFLTQLGYPDAPIGFINRPMKDITPQFLKEENIRYWYCYHYDVWLRDNFEPLDGKEPSASDPINGAPETKMFAPMLAVNQEGIDKFLDEMSDRQYVDQFVLSRAALSTLIELEFLPVSAFCTIDVEKFIQLERSLEMEKSEILSTGQVAVKEVMTRLGETTQPSVTASNFYLDEMEELIFSLKATNNKDSINVFKTNLARLNILMSKLYSSTPFNSGEDMEALLNQMSLNVDTSEEEYLSTEKYWNDLGVKTIKREVTLETGEIIYRCICAETIQPKPGLVLMQNQVLGKYPAVALQAKAADYVAIEGYFV